VLCQDKEYDYASTWEIAARLRLLLHQRTRGKESQAKHRGGNARCWEKKATNYEAMLHLACATIVAGQTGVFG